MNEEEEWVEDEKEKERTRRRRYELAGASHCRCPEIEHVARDTTRSNGTMASHSHREEVMTR